MEAFMAFNSWLNGIVWGPPMLILIVGTGIYLSWRLGFLQVKYFGYALKSTLFRIFDKHKLTKFEVSPFQALSTAVAATVGVGNIAGVATAIALGGPGAMFWMWVSAFFGMVTKFAEVVLAVKFREKAPDGTWAGGPMYYISQGMNMRWLAIVFAAFAALASFGIGNMVQSNSVAAALYATFGIDRLATGIVIAIVTGAVIVGGLKRIVAFTEKLVPIMAVFYILGSLIIILSRISMVPDAFATIFSYAFTPAAAVGGFTGAAVRNAIRFGIARGVFSNEAGLGSAPIAHATAKTDHPARQGLWGVFEVFLDTIVICSLTALTILVTGVWETGETGAALTTLAFNEGLPGIGGIIVAVGLALFAFSTIIGWSFYGEKCVEYLFGGLAGRIYRYVYLPFIVIGAVGGLTLVWDIADTLNGLMALPNLIALLALSGVVISLTKEFFSGKWSAAPETKE
ncbi:MAG TPA: sodium:alanine symporter family protein [Candidatus Limnocylindrales bacterium]|nr:sodium:alanine symporter family protein [Candidatus Limnocylindrales bacterium]